MARSVITAVASERGLDGRPIQVAVVPPSAARVRATSGNAPSTRFAPRPPAGRWPAPRVRRGRTGPRMPVGTSTASASAVSSGTAIRHGSVWFTPSTRCDRTPRGPIRPAGSSAQRTLVRQPNPLPGNGSTVTSSSSPASRLSCSATTAALSLRCNAASACWKSQPPQPPGWKCRHGASTRPASARSTRITSPRQNEPRFASVIRTVARSPGRASRTKITRPSYLATQ